MEIGFIAGIRPVPLPKSRHDEAELTAAFEIDPSARPDEDTYSSSNGSADGAEEPDAELPGDNTESAEQEVVGPVEDTDLEPGKIDLVI